MDEKRRIVMTVRSLARYFLLLLILSGCGFIQGTSSGDEPTVPMGTPQNAGHCGDGICDGPEDAANCPSDCPSEATSSPSNQPTIPDEPTSDVPPLYFFYAIHTHASNEYLPYDDPAMLNLNEEIAENMVEAIEDIAEVLDKYGVKGTWELLPAGAKGICAYQGENHIFRQLVATGHEVGTHAHRIEQIQGSFLALQDECGIVPKTTSGFVAQIGSEDSKDSQIAMTISLEITSELGMTVGTTNFSPADSRNPFAGLCNSQIGTGNDMWSESGNLMFPWRPDYANGDVCSDASQGDIVLVDHVSIEWIKLPGQEEIPDILGDEHFMQLRGWLDGALEYMEVERPQEVAAWGFVTHITEYALGANANQPLDPEALAALDRFLAYVDSKRAEGRIIYSTASEIADLSFPDR
jgi:hypothetical protein